MTDPENKLTVRVKLAPKPEAGERRQHRYSYRWDRILLAGAALLIVAALALRGLLAPPAPERGSDTASAPEVVAPPVREPSPAAGAKGMEQGPTAAESAAAPQTTGAGEAAPTTADSGNKTAVPASREPAVPSPEAGAPAQLAGTGKPAEAAAVSEEAPPGPAAEQPGAATLPGKALTEEIAGSPPESVTASTTAEPARDSILTPGETRLLSKQVKRFLLTDGVRNREPMGGLTDVVPKPADSGVLAVYAYSDVEGMAGKTLHYRWILDGKIRAEVRVGVGSDRWRSYSSKIVTGKMRGPWRVELTSGRKELLAEAEFRY
jgi:hypothetical protein